MDLPCRQVGEEPTEETVLDIPPLIPKPGGMGMMKLRQYQCDAVDAIYEAWLEHRAVLCILPTGMGKTVLAAEVIIRWPGTGRILFVAHVKELIGQAQEKIDYHTDDSAEVEMGTQTALGKDILENSRVIVASVQTMRNRKRKFNPADIDLLIIDECHHAAGGANYRSLVQWLYDGNPNAKVLGITATADRADGISIGCVFDHCAYEMGIRDGIDEGWLVPIKQRYFTVEGLDFSACRTTKKSGESDFREEDLETAMLGGKASQDMSEEERQQLIEQQERMLHRVAAPTVREANGRSGIVYCVTVEHAVRMSEVLRRYPGVTAEVVCGETPADERTDIMTRFKGGVTQFLVNVAVAVEGFDAPTTQLIIMARPTKSRAFYAQAIGRGTRPLAGLVDRYETPEERQQAIANSIKPAMEVFDFVGNTGKHKLVSTADVLAGDMPEPFIEAAKKQMRETGEAADIRQLAWQKKEEHDEEVKRRQEEERQRQEERRKELEARKQAQREEELRRRTLRAEAEYRTKNIDPFATHDVAPDRVQPEFRGGATDSQVKFLVQLGIRQETAMKWTKKQAGAVISERGNRVGGQFIMRFGKHQGKSIHDIPIDYLKWAGQNVEDAKFQTNLQLYRQEWWREHKKVPPPADPK